MMEKNVGSIDSVIRVMIGLVLLFVAAVVARVWIVSAAAVLIALVLLYTALSERCPAYRLFGWSTRKEPGAPVGPAVPRQS